jgi:DNA polymerase III epsilon subunit-like protein
MRVLVFDTETTGLPQTKIINPDTLNQWPTILQFSYIIFDISLNNIIESRDYFIKIPENILISEENTKIHGITNKICSNKGVPITEVLSEFFCYLRDVDLIVGHNIQFDINMIKVELLRLINRREINDNDLLEDIRYYKYNLHYITNYTNIYCTLQESIDFCNIKVTNKSGKEYLKYPKLIELHQKLFNTTPNNLHNSLNDILVTLRCFIKLKYNYDLIDNCSSFRNYSIQLNLF